MKNILCFGDSLTAGYYNDGNNFYPYSKKLEELFEYQYNIDYIGLSGWTTEEMIDNKDNIICEDSLGKKWVGLRVKLRKKIYNYCIILVGTNDLDENNREDIFKNLLRIHNIAKEEGCQTIALTIPAMRIESVMPEIKEKRQKINNCLKSSKEFNTIDITKFLSDASFWDIDGLHFTPNGYNEIAFAIKEHIHLF